MYEQPEVEFVYNYNNLIEREIYQIFLNFEANTKAFLDYWKTLPLSRPVEVRAEGSTVQASTSGKGTRAGKQLHKRVLLTPGSKARRIQRYFW